MNNLRKYLFQICAVSLVVAILFGCTQNVINPVQETYTYSINNKYYVQPAVVDGWAERDALTTTTEDGTFYCFTADTAQADDFINAQRTLLLFLGNCGVEIGEMEYYGTDYGYSFSESSENSAYVALSDVCTWQQVLVTLQAIWGDYTDYGYVYAMAKAVAEELAWETDANPAIEKNALNAFFTENPDAIHLLYPTLTTKFASEETVKSCKALSRILFDKIKWHKALAKPIEEQLDGYYSLLSDYAQNIDIPFIRHSCGYAYYGENVPLRILTSYTELLIEANYMDADSQIYGDYFSDYASIFETTEIIDAETSAAVEYFGLENEVGIVTIKWLNKDNTTAQKFLKGRTAMYYLSTETVYVSSIWLYLHEFYHHFEHLLDSTAGNSWQSQAFCELGSSYSKYSVYLWEWGFTQNEQLSEIFYACTGRTYQTGRDNFYEAMDIITYVQNNYNLDYFSGGSQMNSITRYLVDLYGENTVFNLMLFPETVEEVTGKSWETLESEWEQHLQNKYANAELPDWASDYFS